MIPKSCLYCTNIFYTKQNDPKKFCNQSHAASYNNANRSQEHRDRQKKTLQSTLDIKRNSTFKAIRSRYVIEPDLLPISNIVKCYNFVFDEDQKLITTEQKIRLYDKIFSLIHIECLSCEQIRERFDIDIKSFSSFIIKTLKIPLRSVRDALNNYCLQKNTSITDDKRLYWKKCRFRFNVFKEPNVINHTMLFQHDFSKLHRDHMISISYGWNNSIDPSIISHPANCEIMLASDNLNKATDCSITLEQLLERIEDWYIDPKFIYNRSNIKITLSDQHKKNLSLANIGKKYYTNGIVNVVLNTNDIVPDGFWRGVTRKKSGSPPRDRTLYS